MGMRVSTGMSVLLLLLSSPAGASSSPTPEELHTMVKALQARISALEGEARASRREANEAKAELRAVKGRAVTLSHARLREPKTERVPVVAAVGSEIDLPPPPSWAGPYAGIAFGLIDPNLRSRATRFTESRFESLSESRSESLSGSLGSFTSFGSQSSTSTSSLSTSVSTSALQGRGKSSGDLGAGLSAFAGYNLGIDRTGSLEDRSKVLC